MVKGIAEPVTAWRAMAPSGADTGRALGSFVGRRSELAQFDGVLAACQSTQNGQVIVVRGEAGFGKSRLIAEFVGKAEAQGFQAHKCLVLDFGVGRGQDVISTLVAGMLGIDASDDAAARAAIVTQAAERGSFAPGRRMN